MPPPSITAASPISSGLPHLVPSPQPDLKYRQVLEPDYIITLSITRDTTTFTTVIILGGTAAPSTTNFQSSSEATTTVITAPGSTTSSVATVGNGSTSTGTHSKVIVGAVLGGIFGTILCLILLWLCCYSPYGLKWLNWQGAGPFDSDGGTEMSSWNVESRKSSRRRRRPVVTAVVGPGRIRRPSPTYVRKERIIVDERRETERLYERENEYLRRNTSDTRNRPLRHGGADLGTERPPPREMDLRRSLHI
jgi:hypothetical protein